MLTRGWCRSSLGKKAIVAVTGAALLVFVIMHLAGNLLIFGGAGALNAYAEKLRHLAPLVWCVRLSLLAALVVHVWLTVLLARDNAAARPRSYRKIVSRTTTMAARAMLLSGGVFVAYLIYHLLHFTFRVTNPEISNAVDEWGRRDVYRMVVLSFQQWPITAAYVVGVAAVSWHLSHGIGSTVQTLGLGHERTIPVVTRLGRLAALLIFLGYASIPLSVLLRIVK